MYFMKGSNFFFLMFIQQNYTSVNMVSYQLIFFFFFLHCGLIISVSYFLLPNKEVHLSGNTAPFSLASCVSVNDYSEESACK